MNMQKKDRQNAVLKLVEIGEVSSQFEIASKLAADGFSVTQASVSRDLDELGVVKVNGRYSLRSRRPFVSEFGTVNFYKAGDNLIVGKCSSGLASAITVRIDAAAFPEIVGTIAGDDTIFIAVKNGEEQKSVMKNIDEMFA